MNSTSLEWLFNNASVLLWADKLLMTKKDFAHLHEREYFDDEVDRECARMLFDRLHEEGVIEVFSQDDYLNEITLDSIAEQVEKDEALWGTPPPPPGPDGRVEHNTIRIGDRAYCPPVIQGVYGSLTLARFLDCSCVFDRRERGFLEDRFAALASPPEFGSKGQRVFNDLYQVLLPRLSPEHDYRLFCHPQESSTCAHASDCRRDAPQNLQRLIEHVLVAREKPELLGLARRLDDLELEVGPDESRIRRALMRDIQKEQKNLRVAYPAVRHWSRLTQAISAPALLYGTQTGQPLIWMSAAGIAALAEAVHTTVDAIQEKHRWLTLLADAAEPPAARTSTGGRKALAG